MRPRILLLLLLAGCGRSAAPSPSPDPAPSAVAPAAAPAAGTHYGAPFALASPEPLAQALARASTTEQQVQVTGTVDSVCQAAGCWMILRDGEVKTRIFSKDHSFFLPKDCAGKGAVAEGVLRPRTIDQDFARHLEEDRGGDPSKVTGPQREYVMTATGVKLL